MADGPLSFKRLLPWIDDDMELSSVAAAALGAISMFALWAALRWVAGYMGERVDRRLIVTALAWALALLQAGIGLAGNTDWTWAIFVPLSDPDAARLSLWYGNPLTVRSCYRWSYRPPLGHQPANTFPVREGPRRFDDALPETRALMGVIDDLCPSLDIALHNSDFEGAWFPVNRRLGGLGDVLRSLVADGRLPLEPRPVDGFGCESDGPGVFILPPTTSASPAASASARLDEYLPPALYIAPEVPLWRVKAPVPPSRGYRKGLMRLAQELSSAIDFIAPRLAAVGDLPVRTAFEPAVAEQMDFARARAEQWRAWDNEVSPDDYTTTVRSLHLFRLRSAGMLLRALEANRAAKDSRALRAAIRKVDQRFETWCGACEATLRPQPVPREDLVLIQVETALAAARHIEAGLI